ncbi:CAP domain-containing protein [Maribacter sp. MMG018]|uniref:CAP domain-containing protein n=1 Tax=Maribacter sp. MMG018 TaxID=2822688 RepID=UPI001B37AE39|nr:CAP domain-containing protein [Maribacter sp. MMG018]MBQ4914399.1 CAP domain-containing protein [Maribacter sp. MMG018]
MKSPILILFMVVVLLTSCSKDANEVYEKVALTATTSDMEEQILDLVNEYRVSKGLVVLEVNSAAKKYATAHNEYMISKDEISHDNFLQRASDLSLEINAIHVAENVARDFDTAEEVFNAWLLSAAHLKNIIGDFTETAISVDTDAEGRQYFTQVFIK